MQVRIEFELNLPRLLVELLDKLLIIRHRVLHDQPVFDTNPRPSHLLISRYPAHIGVLVICVLHNNPCSKHGSQSGLLIDRVGAYCEIRRLDIGQR